MQKESLSKMQENTEIPPQGNRKQEEQAETEV